MQKKRKTRGFTLAELMVVVAVIAALSGAAFVGVNRYQRSLGLRKRNAIAKEIFVAAQNHLTTAESQGYLGGVSFGTLEDESKPNIYYYAVSGGSGFTTDGNTALDLMLPFGSIDEVVRTHDSYIIRYQARPARVLDVFYCTLTDEKYNHSLSGGELSTLMAARPDPSSGKDYLVGWYGGATELPTGDYIETPLVEISNKEKLTVKVTDTNPDNANAYITLIITGQTSGAKAAIPVKGDSSVVYSETSRVRTASGSHEYTVVLDDITQDNGMFSLRFRALYDDAAQKQVGRNNQFLLPGENITVEAVAYSSFESATLTNIAYSGGMTANSLFADIENVAADAEGGTPEHTVAKITNLRHLENLDDRSDKSKLTPFTYTDSSLGDVVLIVTEAWQLVDLAAPGDDAEEGAEDLSWQGFQAATTADYAFQPVSPTYALTYKGNGHSIEGVTAAATGTDPAGLFGNLAAGSAVSDLQLVDFTVTSASGDAGALAGSLTNANITNVVARDSADRTAATAVKSTAGNAGGLVGSMTGGKLDKCAAALYVQGDTAAGGLVGVAEGSAEIASSYSGGHTTDGKYVETGTRDVIATGTGASAGGLVGQTSGTDGKIANCYSTCSVQGAVAGGFAGKSTVAAENCYATGLVQGSGEGSLTGAFAGSMTGTAVGCHYFRFINGEMAALGNAAADKTVTPLDADADAYNTFVGEAAGWRDAEPGDDKLEQWFGGKYCLGGLAQLGLTAPAADPDDPVSGDAGAEETIPDFVAVHYGGWPSPESFIINVE